MNKELVSILINNYNYEQFIAKAIDSAIAQTYENIEIIVVDDGSTDSSPKIIERYQTKVVSVAKENSGQASAFNAGFAHSRGEIICFLDADDLFIPSKIEKIASVFNSHAQIGWCFHPVKLVDKYSQPLASDQTYQAESGIYDIRENLKNGKLNGKLPRFGVVTSGLCYRRSLLEKLLPMPESIKITSDDYLKYAAFALSPGYVLLEELSWQTIHDCNAYTQRKDKDDLRAKVNIATAYQLRHKIPSVVKFTNNIFALGLSIYQKLLKQDRETQLLIDEYFSETKISEKAKIYLKSFYYSYIK